MNGPMFTSGSALNEKGEQIEGIKTKGFASVIDSIGNGRYQFTLLISKWISEEDIEYTTSNGYIEVIKSETFQNIFTRGERLYAKNANPINTTDEVLIEYTDENGVYWGSSYQGNFYSTPSYSSLQPSASFNITRRMPFGNDSVFVEAKFKVRLYKNTSEYFEINDGYFRGFYYRKF